MTKIYFLYTDPIIVNCLKDNKKFFKKLKHLIYIKNKN